MKTLNIASTLTNINDLYIAEAAEMPYETAVIPAEKRQNPFVRFLNSGWGVAVICCLVAAAVLVGIIAAGRAAGPVTILPGAGPTHPNFSFDYELDPKQDTYLPGDTFTVKTEVKNLGIPFTVQGSSQAFSADAWLIPHGSTDVYTAKGRINGLFAYTEDYVVQTIGQGDEGKHSGIFTIPETTIPESTVVGDYDLVLSYKDEYQIFENVVTVIKDTTPPTQGSVTLGHGFTLSSGPYNAGMTATIDFSVQGIDPSKGDPYIQGSNQPDTYVLSAILTRHGTETYDTSAIVGTIIPNTRPSILSSNKTLRYYAAVFEIPSNAIGGTYDLHLQYFNTEGEYEVIVNSVTEKILTIKGTHSRFDFNYSVSPYSGTLVQGQSYTINTVVTNKGEPFTVTGSSMEFSAEAHLVHHDDPEKTIRGTFWYTEDVVTQEIAAGQIGRHQGYFTIPADAATGKYDLWLYYGGEYQVFENAITIIAPDAVPPLSTVNDYEEASTERLKGFTYDEFIQAWGQPGAYDSDANVYYWRVPNQASYDYVTVWFDGSNIAQSAEYAYVMKVTVLETRYTVDDPRNLLVEPYGDRWNYQISLGLHNTAVESRADTIAVGTTLYVTYSGGINETAPCHFSKVIGVTFEPPVP
ncbi:MAG: hypothetical protein IJW00_09410 [Clostridia bacterium]|nr:hypothetical protein [Clostridia bacterium]